MNTHEILVNILASAVLPLASPFSAIRVTGVLKERFGYEIKQLTLSDVLRDIFKKKGASPPDLVLVNEKLKMVVAVECKSDFNLKTIEKISKQVDFYSSDTFIEFAKSFLPDLKMSEIWIVTYSEEKLSEHISHFIEKKKAEIKSQCNIIVWEVELKKTDVAVLRKVFGDYQDCELKMHMQATKEIETALPQFELLIDTSLTYGQRVARIGRRILSFIASKSLTEEEKIVSITDFKNRFGDAIITDKELANCFRYLTRLVPEIGRYVTQKRHIILTARPDLSKIKNRIEALENIPDEEFKVELGKAEKGIPVGRNKAKKPAPFKGSLEPWIKKEDSFLRYYDFPETSLNFFPPYYS
jgi:hypothetical protein